MRATSARRSVIGGTDDAYQEAFGMSAEEWDQQFDRYMKERFKPFRDKRPADYGRNSRPPAQEPVQQRPDHRAPVGRPDAAMTGNGRDRELDIVLIRPGTARSSVT